MSSEGKTRIYISGIRTPDAMTAALEGGADFVGLDFRPCSSRFVDIEVAAYLANYVPSHVQVVGHFENPSLEMFAQALQNVRIDVIQLNGPDTEENRLIAAPFGKSFIFETPGDMAELGGDDADDPAKIYRFIQMIRNSQE